MPSSAFVWLPRVDSNHEPSDKQSEALPIELQGTNTGSSRNANRGMTLAYVGPNVEFDSGSPPRGAHPAE